MLQFFSTFHDPFIFEGKKSQHVEIWNIFPLKRRSLEKKKFFPYMLTPVL